MKLIFSLFANKIVNEELKAIKIGRQLMQSEELKNKKNDNLKNKKRMQKRK